jgi:hypothetical protein
MKVKIKRSWNNPLNGRTIKEGSVLDIPEAWYTEDYHEKVKATKKSKK